MQFFRKNGFFKDQRNLLYTFSYSYSFLFKKSVGKHPSIRLNRSCMNFLLNKLGCLNLYGLFKYITLNWVFRNGFQEPIQAAIKFKLKIGSLGKKEKKKGLRFKLGISLGSTLLNVKEYAKQMENSLLLESGNWFTHWLIILSLFLRNHSQHLTATSQLIHTETKQYEHYEK